METDKNTLAEASGSKTCEACGAQNRYSNTVCGSCGIALPAVDRQWAKKRDRLKTLWVIAVVMFWLSLGFQVVLHEIQGRPNLILWSVILGMMVLGVGLKVRLRLHERKQKSRGPGSGQDTA